MRRLLSSLALALLALILASCGYSDTDYIKEGKIQEQDRAYDQEREDRGRDYTEEYGD